MNRILLAFLLAPLWAPLMAAFYGIIVLEQHGLQMLQMVGIAAVIAYAGMVLLVFPTVLVLRAFQLTGPWTAIIAGFVIGMILWLIFDAAYQRFLLECSLESTLLGLERLLSEPALALGSCVHGIVGVIAGFTFWLIAKPSPPAGPWARSRAG